MVKTGTSLFSSRVPHFVHAIMKYNNIAYSKKKVWRLLEIRVRKRLGDFLLDAELSLEETGITVLFGRSGAGKTTLVNLIAGLLSPDEGFISHGGDVFFDSERGIALPPEKRGLGCVFQQHRLFSHMSAKSNLLFASRFCGRPVGDDFYRKVVDLLGIGHLLDRRPNTLSGGESQRVAIGRALLACKSFLLMDEPLSSLDSDRKEDLLGYIASIPQKLGVPIIYVTHSIEELSFLADHVLVIEAGRSETLMEPQEFLQSYTAFVPERLTLRQPARA